MTTDVELTTEDLGLIKRVLAFAAHDLPISDALGNKLYPSTETRKHATDLDNRLTAAGVEIPSALFTDFDPFVLEGKIATARYVEPDAEHTIKGRVQTVVQNPETEHWEVTFSNGTTFFYGSRDELKANSYVELDQP